MIETWRDIPNTGGVYQASDLGRIRSTDRTIQKMMRWGEPVALRIKGRVLRPWTDANGYLVVYVCGGGRRDAVNVHRLVAAAFLEPSPLSEVNHLDGDKQNNRPGNLEWSTRTANMAHARWSGLLPQVRGYIGTPIHGGPELHFASEREAAAAVGAAKRGNISSAANGKLRQAYGYFWRHA